MQEQMTKEPDPRLVLVRWSQLVSVLQARFIGEGMSADLALTTAHQAAERMIVKDRQ